MREANLPDGRTGQDIACAGGRIAAIERKIAASAAVEIDGRGCLVSPPFIDGHLHMDAALLQGRPRVNQTGGLYEGIGIWAEAKKTVTREDYKARARQVCHWSIAQGTLHIR